jgi:hypothetical protein
LPLASVKLKGLAEAELVVPPRLGLFVTGANVG